MSEISKATIVTSVYSDVGLKRNNNEDNFLINQISNKDSCNNLYYTDIKMVGKTDLFFCGVFDGMGGGENGEIAAVFATEEISRELSGEFENSKEIDCAVQRGFLSANNRIIDKNLSHKLCGTTATVLCLFHNKFRIYHLGDSRAYLLRDNHLFQLTKDQTLAEMKRSLGFYQSNDLLMEEEKHQLTNYIGADLLKEGLEPTKSEWIDLQNGDKIFMCSDGLYDMCPENIIQEVLKQKCHVEVAVNELVKIALANGGLDNVTCLLAEYVNK